MKRETLIDIAVVCIALIFLILPAYILPSLHSYCSDSCIGMNKVCSGSYKDTFCGLILLGTIVYYSVMLMAIIQSIGFSEDKRNKMGGVE